MARIIDSVLWPLVATRERYLVTLVVAAFAPSLLIYVPEWPSATWVYLAFGGGGLFLQALCGVTVLRSRTRFEHWEIARDARAASDERVRARTRRRLMAQTAEMVQRDQELDPLPPWHG